MKEKIFKEGLEELKKLCKENANKHGFYIEWERGKTSLNPIEALMKIVSEASEAMEAYVSQTLPNNGKNKVHQENWKENFEEEIIDMLIRIFHLAGDLELDLFSIFKKKMEYNKRRPKLHGKLT